MLILGSLGYGIGAATSNVPVEYLGLLGFVPISIGTIELIRLHRGRSGVTAVRLKSTDRVQTVFVATLISQLGNGADTIVVFSSLFADSMHSVDFIIILTLAAMAVIFVLVGIYAVQHPAVGELIERHAHRVMPYGLIIVGIYILADTPTDLMAN